MFAPLLSALPETINPVVVAYPTDEEFGYDELTRLSREAIPESGPYSILGESFSGPIAISLASEADSRLAALFLCCSFASNPSRTLAAISPILQITPVKSALAELAALYLLGADSSELKDAVRKTLRKVDARVLRNRLRELTRVNVTKDLLSVSAPIQYLQASDDRLVPKNCAQYICEVAPSTEMCEINGPHLLLQKQPERSSEAIVGFLKKNGAI